MSRENLHGTGKLTKFMSALTGTRDDNFIASYKDDTLTSQKLPGDNTGKASKKMVAAVDDLGFFKHHGLGGTTGND